MGSEVSMAVTGTDGKEVRRPGSFSLEEDWLGCLLGLMILGLIIFFHRM